MHVQQRLFGTGGLARSSIVTRYRPRGAEVYVTYESGAAAQRAPRSSVSVPVAPVAWDTRKPVAFVYGLCAVSWGRCFLESVPIWYPFGLSAGQGKAGKGRFSLI